MTPNQYRCGPIELKCWSISFQAIKNGTKRVEYRKDDRPYEVGRTLWQREWNPSHDEENDCLVSGGGYTGDELYQDVTFIIRGGVFGIPEGYCIMSVSEPRGCASHSDFQSERDKVLDEVDKILDSAKEVFSQAEMWDVSLDESKRFGTARVTITEVKKLLAPLRQAGEP